MSSARRCIFLAGAPESQNLDWDEDDLLPDFGLPIQRFLQPANTSKQRLPAPTPSGTIAKWRSVPFTGSDNRHYDYDHNNVLDQTQFLSFEVAHTDDQRNLQFLEHSIAVLDDLESSQIVPPSDGLATDRNKPSDPDTTFLSTASFANTSFTESSFQISDVSMNSSHDQEGLAEVRLCGPTTDLKRIPTADHITRIQPQTVTVNLLAGVIAISQPRMVQLWKRKTEMDIIELTVGDESRAGFSISFWLVPVESQVKPADDLRNALSKLRAGDVVLLQNLALSCFKGCVYGQSLSKRFARNSTTVDKIGRGAQEGDPVLKAKLERVRRWTSDFVGGGREPPHPGTVDVMRSHGRPDLPPDTQDE